MISINFLASCSIRNEAIPQKTDNATTSENKPPKSRLNIHSREDCLNFLKGKNFYGDKARLEFHYDSNAYIYSKADNNALFTGHVTVDQTLGSEGRMVRIHDTFGGEQVIILLLKEDGSLTDLSDYALFQYR